jgi:hypothetical protein
MRADAGQRGQAFLDVGIASDSAHLVVVGTPPLDATLVPTNLADF